MEIKDKLVKIDIDNRNKIVNKLEYIKHYLKN